MTGGVRSRPHDHEGRAHGEHGHGHDHHGEHGHSGDHGSEGNERGNHGHGLERDDHQHREHGHDHGHGAHEHGHDHGPGEHGHGEHGHAHPHGGWKGFLYDVFVPHTHDSADSIDDAMEASTVGIRALKISLLILLATTVLQAVVVAFTGSIALLADTVHNFADALTAVPLWIAFVLSRRAANRRYTYGYGRAEDLAGMFIVFVVALSAVVAGWQAIDRLITPRPIEFPWLLVAAGLIGFAGNEAVAIYRIRVGRPIGSAALIADGVHARLDGFTSLSVVLGAVGVLLGFPIADPIIGLLISVSIMVLLWGTVKSVGARLMDAIDPSLVSTAERALAHTPGVVAVRDLRLRWVGHRLTGSAVVEVDTTDLHVAERAAEHATAHVREAIGKLDEFIVTPAGRIHRRELGAAPEDAPVGA